MDKAIRHARENRDAHLNELIEFLSIPSISTLPEHKPDIQRAAEWLAADMRRMKMEDVQIIQTAGNPVVFGEWLKAGEDKPAIMIYGHYDTQPVDPLEAWTSPPFQPTVRDGKVYARGASDNKGQHFCHLKAIESVLKSEGSLPINIKVCLDGEEEVGSPSLVPFVEEYKDLLACDSILISDGMMAAPGKPSVEYAIRGIVDFDVNVYGPERDLHSGNYGGTVHNPAQAAAELVAALHDENGRVTIPGFYDKVQPLSQEEKDILAKVGYDEAQWRGDTGAPKPWGEPDHTLLERITARPTCEVNGIWGGFSGEGMKTIIPAEAGVKISMRLVADQDEAEIAQLFEDFVAKTMPDTVTYKIHKHSGANAAVTAYKGPEITAVARAYEAVWDVKPVLNRVGGSLPIVVDFQRILKAPFVLMPLGLDDNRHSPNEHYILEYLYKGIETAIHYYFYLAEERS